MANSELSKLKILFMYDFFMKHLNAFDSESTVTVNDIIGYLESSTGTTFERKSIYADISRINEYINKTENVKYGDSWISTEGKKYRRNQLEGEITIDEARLIVDAISTTAFVNTDVCKKIIKMFPTCFSKNYEQQLLYSHDEKIKSSMISWLNTLRSGIESREPRKITYGYKLGNELTEKEEKIISPMALDWQNNCYYLIAIDNAAAEGLERDHALTEALRRYRVDRIASAGYTSGKEKFIDYKSEKLRRQELEDFINHSVSAYASNKSVNVDLLFRGKTRKDVLKAYNALISRNHTDVKIKDDTKLDKGILEIYITTGDVPTFYTGLFELSTFKNVEIEILTPEICSNYAVYIKNAAKAAKLDRL